MIQIKQQNIEMETMNTRPIGVVRPKGSDDLVGQFLFAGMRVHHVQKIGECELSTFLLEIGFQLVFGRR